MWKTSIKCKKTGFLVVLDQSFWKLVATALDRSLSGPWTIPRLPKAVQSGPLPKKAKKPDRTGLLNSSLTLASPRMTSREAIARGDEALLSQLGYKQEFKCAFTPFEVCFLHLSRVPTNSWASIAHETLVGVWGVLQHYCPPPIHCVWLILVTIGKCVLLCSGLCPSKWWRICYGVGGMCWVPFGECRYWSETIPVACSLAFHSLHRFGHGRIWLLCTDVCSSTTGRTLSSPHCRNLLCWIVGCTFFITVSPTRVTLFGA